MIIRFLFVLFFIGLKVNAYSQVEGTVFDLETNSPIQNAYVLFVNSQVISDERGYFNITTKVDTLIISHLGYKTKILSGLQASGKISVYLVPVNTQLEQITVKSGMGHHRLLNMPSSVSLLTKNALTESSGISYVEKLNQLPGIFVHQGTLNTNRITIRGIGSRSAYATNRIKAYYNEIPLTNGDGTTEIEDVNASIINTIEVLKGSKSALYGSGLGGVILISGKNYFEEGLHGMASLEVGSFQTAKPELGIQYKKNNVAVGASYANTQTTGWRQNSEYNRHNLNAFARYTGKHSSTELLVQFVKTKAYIPSSINEQTFNNAPDSAAPNWLATKGFEDYQKGLLGIKHKQKLGANTTNTTVLFSGFKQAYELRPFNILSEDAKNLGMRNVTELKYKNLDFQAGFEVMIDRYEWSINENNSENKGALLSKFSEDRKPLNLFLQTGINFKKGTLLEAGLSYNFLSYSLTDLSNNTENVSGSYSYNPVLSPYLGINVPIKKQWHVYGSVSHGFSAPSVEETLMPSGEINPDLKPETGWNIETGFRLNSPKGYFFLDANIYLLLIDNLLVTERLSEEVFYGKNAGSSKHSGFEISNVLRLNNKQLFKLPQMQVNVSYNYSQPVFTKFVDNENDYGHNFLPGVPKQNFWTSIHLKYIKGFFGLAQLQCAGKQYLNDSNSEQYSRYLLTHFKLGYKTETATNVNYEFALGVKNAFDTHYASMILVNAPSFGSTAPRYYYPGEPRSFYVAIIIDF